MEITTNTLVQKIAEGREFHRVMKDSRDKLLQLSIGMELDLKETQQLLKTAGKSILYAKMIKVSAGHCKRLRGSTGGIRIELLLLPALRERCFLSAWLPWRAGM